MDPQLLFEWTFWVAVPFWALMIVAPGWSVTRRVVSSPLIVVPPVLIYAALVLPQLAEVFAAVKADEISDVAAFFATPAGAAAGWAHFIAFDLFVGRWIYLDSRERGLRPLMTGPVLVLTIFLAPLGLLAYLPLRAAGGRRGGALQPA